jgi:hypothetical protein
VHLRWLPVLVALAVVGTACGDNGLLDEVGARSQRAVVGETTTTITVVVDDEDARETPVSRSAELSWWNDKIVDQSRGEPSFVTQQVWERSDRQSTHIQASRVEISDALPGLVFPELVPGEVEWITSQLVFDTASGTLDLETSAAFGMWPVEPYSVAGGSSAVLRVGVATASQQEIYATPIPEFVEDGMTIFWADGVYRYELFCRFSLPEELCWRMQETSRSLQDQIPRGVLGV